MKAAGTTAKHTVTLLLALLLTAAVGLRAESNVELFDMAVIRDSKTLAVEVLQDWHVVAGPINTRQKLVTINVGEIWAGQDYRIPVKMIVPADRKAKGFHLTGGHSPDELKIESRLDPLKQALLKGGVGLVYTVVQEPATYGQAVLGRSSEERFAKSLNPRHKIQYWAWPATLMRAVTAAYAEPEHFEEGNVAVSGASKNGASPSLAILHDVRMTAVHAAVSPIWDSPLRLCDRAAWDEHEAQGGKQSSFSGGHFGPNFNRAALDAGHTWEELQKFAHDISGGVFISRNLKPLRARGVDMLFHPGTHDMVAYDLAWGGAHHPDIPVYLGANTGHGKKGYPQIERDERNADAFLLRHFFPEKVEPLLTPPVVEQRIEGGTLKVTVRFASGSGEESGCIWWIYDRAPDGSPKYLSELIPDENTAEMIHDARRGVWTAGIKLDPKAACIDFFTNHRKALYYDGKPYATYLSSPYTRVTYRMGLAAPKD
jgi:hypothetical protein